MLADAAWPQIISVYDEKMLSPEQCIFPSPPLKRQLPVSSPAFPSPPRVLSARRPRPGGMTRDPMSAVEVRLASTCFIGSC